MKARKLALFAVIVLSLFGVASSPASVAIPIASAQQVDPDVDFVYQTYDKLEEDFYNPLFLPTTKLFNAALDGVSAELKKHNLDFVHEKIDEQADLNEVYTIFPAEMARAQKLAATINDMHEHQLAFAAASALLNAVDDSHTYFIPPFAVRSKAADIGVIIRKLEDNFYYVDHVFNGLAAAKAGIKKFDRLVAINGQPVGNNLDDIMAKMTGMKGSELELTVERKNVSLKIKAIRGDGYLVPAEGEILKVDGHTYTHLTIHVFANDVRAVFYDFIRQGRKSNSEGMILDLRGDPGGDGVVMGNILNYLLAKGTVIFASRSSSGYEVYQSRGPGDFRNPLVVLIDGHSYSAAEMTASALKEAGRATVVGQKSGGMVGTGDYLSLPYKALMMVNVAEIFTAKDQPMEKTGVEPDVAIEFTKENIINGEDAQLKAALAELKKLVEK